MSNEAEQQAGPPSTLYKYKVGIFQNQDVGAVEQMLNDYGAGGWQLATLARVGEHRMMAVMVMAVSSVGPAEEPGASEAGVLASEQQRLFHEDAAPRPDEGYSEYEDAEEYAEQAGTETETEAAPAEYEVEGGSAEVGYAEEPQEPSSRSVRAPTKPKRPVKRKK